MAYMSQERKAKIAPKVKSILTKYGLKGSLAVRHHSTLVLTIKSGMVDFYNDMKADPYGKRESAFIDPNNLNISINPYWYKEHFTGKALAFLSEVMPIMNTGNHDNSDTMTDYFDVGWYVDIDIGKWNKPYKFINATTLKGD